MDLEKIAIEKIIEMIKNNIPTIPEVIRSKPYGVVHDSVFVNIDGQKGRIVWDYIIWNELTFEKENTGEKISLFSSMSDDETQKKFDEYKKQYGV